MSYPGLSQLLVLQDRDMRRLKLEAQLQAIPREVAGVEQRIATEKQAIETSRGELKELESRKKLLETEIGSEEEKLARYRTQQMQVKKNDEYQALGHEIETVQGQIGQLEEDELKVLYGIDEARKRFATAEAELRANITGHEERIRSLREREQALTAELETSKGEVEKARGEVDPRHLRVYDRVALGQKPPICVPIHQGKCGGCHLKVSSEVESNSRGKSLEDGLPTCDQCGRIVYWEG